MELLVFGHAGTPVVVFPASMGRFFDCENRGMIDAVAGKYENGGLQALCVPFVRSRNASPQFPPDFRRICTIPGFRTAIAA